MEDFKIVEEWRVVKTPIVCDLETYKQLLALLLNRTWQYRGLALQVGALLQIIPKLFKHVQGRMDKERLQKKYGSSTKKKVRSTKINLLPVEREIILEVLKEELEFIESGVYLSDSRTGLFYAYLRPLLEYLEEEKQHVHAPLGNYGILKTNDDWTISLP